MQFQTIARAAAFWACIATLLATVCGLPSLMGRSSTDGLTLNTIFNPNFNANGTAAKLKAVAKFSHLVDSDSTVRYQYSTTTGGKLSLEQSYNSSTAELTPIAGKNLSGFAEANDREWLCPVQIGTPAQTVYLDLDTGSGDL